MDYLEFSQKINKTFDELVKAFEKLADCLRQIFPESNHKYKDKRQLNPPMKMAQKYNIVNHCEPIYNKRIKQFQYRKIAR